MLLTLLLDNVSQLKRSLDHVSNDKLITKLKAVYAHSIPTSAQRVGAFIISRELSQRGIAPRWQFDDSEDDVPLNVIVGRHDKDEREAVKRARLIKKQDKPIFDLAWLSIAYPEQITNNDSWQKLFRCDHDWSQWLKIARQIDDRKATRSKKVRELNLNREQLIGCRYLCGSTEDHKLKNLQARLPAVERMIEKDTKHITRQREQLNITARSHYWLAGKVTGWSPAKGARVYKMMTGVSVSRQAVSQVYAKVKHIK